jgi:hypothetical protein
MFMLLLLQLSIKPLVVLLILVVITELWNKKIWINGTISLEIGIMMELTIKELVLLTIISLMLVNLLGLIMKSMVL